MWGGGRLKHNEHNSHAVANQAGQLPHLQFDMSEASREIASNRALEAAGRSLVPDPPLTRAGVVWASVCGLASNIT